MEYKQLSIYDFLKEEQSQEVAPSETLPQVDETQTGALDVKSPLCPVCMNLEWRCDHEVYKPTEDTDSKHHAMETLFSVGDTVKVRQASDFYCPVENPESYYFIKDREGLEGIIIQSVENEQFICSIGIDGERCHFYHKELQKI